jgi:soluble lytic murein transglycosylase-like protein
VAALALVPAVTACTIGTADGGAVVHLPQRSSVADTGASAAAGSTAGGRSAAGEAERATVPPASAAGGTGGDTAAADTGASSQAGATNPGAAHTPSAAELAGLDANARRFIEAVHLRRTDPTAARTELAAVLVGESLVEDFALLEAARAELAAGSPSTARSHLRRLLENHPQSVLRDDAALELVRLEAAAGNAAEAATLADRYATSKHASPETSEICLLAGRAVESSDPARAARFYDRARDLSPGSSPALEAKRRLGALREAGRVASPSQTSSIDAEAQRCASEGDHECSVRLLSRLVAGAPASDVTLAGRYARAMASTGRAGEAAQWLEKRAATAGSTSLRARLLYEAGYRHWNGDSEVEALRLFEASTKLATGGSEQPRAWYAIGRIHEKAGRMAPARAAYLRSAGSGTAEARAESRWRVGWTYWLERNWEQARAAFAQAASAAPRGGTGRAEALYWQARAAAKAGNSAEAERAWKQVLDEFPSGYYAAAATERLGRRPAPIVGRAGHSDPASWPANLKRIWQRDRILRAAGLGRLAAADLRRSVRRLGDADRARILPRLAEAGVPDEALRSAIRLNSRGHVSRAEMQHYLYPRPWPEHVERQASRRGLDPYLVWALMRQESGFDPFAVSPARAHGLMQLLPETARRVAADDGAPAPGVEDLFDPAVNVRLGTAYLAALARQFDAKPALMLAAYNAGENAASRWQRQGATWETDELIESISYRETRDYVKKVLRNRANYERLYGPAR